MDLTKQLQDAQHELNVENQKGALKNGDVVASLEMIIKNLTTELELQEKEEEEDTVNQQVAQFMDSLDFEGEDPKELFINAGPEAAKASYNYVNTVIQNAVVAMKKADLQRIKELENSNAAYADKLALLSDDNERLAQELYNKRLELAEMSTRLANAATQLDEERDEVARLNSQVDDLRKEIAVGAVAATQVIDVRSARDKFLEERQKEENAKPVIYNIRWDESSRGTLYLAELAETDETIKIPYFAMTGNIKEPTTMKGKYRVVSSEDATTFRNAYLAAKEPQNDSVDSEQDHSVEEQPVEPPFQNDSESTTNGLAEGTPTEAGEMVTRQEFEGLQAEVKYIKSVIGIQ